ncbi:MAG: NlpC/P60 family protein [Clostridia bacterium]|nr:NlpC/P60 family protein [Clostridia bacterium]
MQENRRAADMAALIEQYRNVPFVHNGRSLDGLDCLGFVVHLYRYFGIYLPDSDGKEIGKSWYKTDPQRYIRNIRKLNGIQVSIDDLKPLDLVYFAIARDIITHTGVMVNQREFAHMSPKRNFVISKMERHWKKRCKGAIRFLELS